MTRQPAISFSISIQHPFNRAGGRTSNVLLNKMDLSALAIRIESAGLCGRSYSESDLDAIESRRRAAIPRWYRRAVTSYPIANLRYRIESDNPAHQIDFVIPHRFEMLALAEKHYLFADHSNQIFDSFRSAWFPFGVGADGSSLPIWVLRADDDSDRLIYQFHDDMWNPSLPNETGNGAFSIGDSFESILARATVFEHVTSDPHTPKAYDLRFESSMPRLKALKHLAPPPNQAEQDVDPNA